MTIVTPNGALYLLGQGNNITETYCLIFPLLSSQATPYDEALEWIKFSYMGDQTGVYLAPALMYFQFNTLTYGEPLFALAIRCINTLYPGAYAQGSRYTLSPLGPAYELYM